jgi:tetrahydromethanopterin S-methyltransferase subunit A
LQALVFRHGMRYVTMLSHLRRVVPMMRYRLDGLAVLGLGPITGREIGITKIIAHAIPRENIRRHQA